MVVVNARIWQNGVAGPCRFDDENVTVVQIEKFFSIFPDVHSGELVLQEAIARVGPSAIGIFADRKNFMVSILIGYSCQPIVSVVLLNIAAVKPLISKTCVCVSNSRKRFSGVLSLFKFVARFSL